MVYKRTKYVHVTEIHLNIYAERECTMKQIILVQESEE